MIGLIAFLMADFSTFQTGRDLAALCRKDRQACVHYVEGAADMISSLQSMGSVPTNICLDPAANGNQLADLTGKYLADHADSLDDGAGKLMWATLHDNFPCN